MLLKTASLNDTRDAVLLVLYNSIFVLEDPVKDVFLFFENQLLCCYLRQPRFPLILHKP